MVPEDAEDPAPIFQGVHKAPDATVPAEATEAEDGEKAMPTTVPDDGLVMPVVPCDAKDPPDAELSLPGANLSFRS
jgi:hypothetical protein